MKVFLYQLQYQRGGIGIQYFGLLLALAQAVRLICVKSHVLSGRFGNIGSIAGIAAAVLLGCVGLIFTSSPVISILLVCFIGGVMALAEPMMTDMQNRTIKPGGDRATILSAYSMCAGVTAAIINPLIGIGADKSVPFGFFVCACLSLAAFLILFLYRKKSAR